MRVKMKFWVFFICLFEDEQFWVAPSANELCGVDHVGLSADCAEFKSTGPVELHYVTCVKLR